MGITIGTGLGAGIYSNGKLYVCANCGAGEFGLLQYLESDYEHYCSGHFFKNVYKTTGKVVYLKVENDNKEAIKVFKEFGQHLGNAVSSIKLSVDPEIVIIGGSISMAFKYFENLCEMN